MALAAAALAHMINQVRQGSGVRQQRLGVALLAAQAVGQAPDCGLPGRHRCARNGSDEGGASGEMRRRSEQI